jgi:hypothetical protein
MNLTLDIYCSLCRYINWPGTNLQEEIILVKTLLLTDNDYEKQQANLFLAKRRSSSYKIS